MEFDLRRATPADVDAIMAIETATFENDAWSPDSMLSELESDNTFYLVAYAPAHPKILVGYAGLLAPDGGEEADVQTIAVAPSARRQGLGREFMVRLIAEAVARQATEVFLEVRADNPTARALYDSLGFDQIAIRKNYYQPDNVDAQVMRLVLDSTPEDDEELDDE
jgi:ribosomal-protein-alanine N-acetyltransferase